MKNNIVFKFLAIVLCTLTLLGAVASGIGIGGLAALGLYETDVDSFYVQQQESRAESLAYFLMNRYASISLGGCPEELVSEYYGSWHVDEALESGELGYEMLDWDRNVLEKRETAHSGGIWYEIPIESGHYLKLLREEGAETESIEIKQPLEEAEQVSTLATEAERAETETEPAEPASETEPEEPTAEEDAEDPTAQTQVEETTITVEITEPASDSTEPTQAETTYPVEEEGFTYTIYDPMTGSHREFLVRHEQSPGFIVRVQLSEDYLGAGQEWELLRIVWHYRMELFWVLGVCLLLFAALAVYLCCAAGHKPGRKEIRAGGLNRIPLDAYAAAVVLGISGLVVVGFEGGEYLLRQDILAAAILVAALGFCCALLFVCFCFAFAAQVKTPDGFWWRNSLCGWCCRLIVVLWNLAVRVLAWMWDIFIRICKWSWRFFLDKLVPLGKRLLIALWKLVNFFWNELVKLLKKGWILFSRVLRWCGKKILRFIALLPLTWQWLLAAFVMIFVLALTVNSYRAGMVLLGLGLTLALVLYGTSAFGTLLESAKRMRKGDLDTKVDETFLIGCFKDFAQELNGLADVAVVAAQKQLKSERMKTELITNVSHDIKTPLTSIINYVDLLGKPHTPEEQEVYLEVLSRQSQRLKKLIEDLMEMSKASTGNLAVEIEVVDAAEAVNQALGEFADKLEKVPLHPVFKQPEEAMLMLADGRLVWRVLSNVLSNAAKYALPGTRLYVDLAKLDGKVVISLKNISREELNVEADELMERFVRGDASRNTEGSGLGLNIAKSLMELQKGQLQLLVDGDLFKVTLVFPGA